MPAVKKILLILAAYFSLYSSAEAVNYYVDTSGSEGNSGLCVGGTGVECIGGTISPWLYIPGTFGSSHTPAAGSTVYCSSSDTWTLSTQNGIGAFSFFNPIAGVTYDGSTWGGGTRAKLEYAGNDTQDTTNFFACITFASDNATYDTVVTGFELDGNSRSANGVLFAPLISRTTPTNTGLKKFDNCVMHDFTNFNDAAYHYGIWIYSSTGLWDTGVSYNVWDVEITNNEIYNIGRVGIAVYPADTSSLSTYNKDIIVRGNYVHDIIGQPADYTDVCYGKLGEGIVVKGVNKDVTVENNIVIYNSGDAPAGRPFLVASQNSGVDGTGMSNIIFRNNIADCGVSDNVGKLGCFSMRDLAGSGEDFIYDVEVYNNIFYDSGVFEPTCQAYAGSIWIIASAGNGDIQLKINNNTLYDSGIVIESGNYSSLEVKNNISYGGDNVGIIIGQSSNVSKSNNLCASGVNCNITSSPGFENTSNLPTGFTGDCDYAGSYTNPTCFPNNDGLSISSGGAAINNGANLGTLYSSSINGVTRTGSWDIGAYEYTVTAPTCLCLLDTNPSTTTTVTGTMATYSFNETKNNQTVYVYYMTGQSSAKPVIFWLHGYGGENSPNLNLEAYRNLVTQGYVVVRPSYPTIWAPGIWTNDDNNPGRYELLWNGCLEATLDANVDQYIDTTKIGVVGHSFGAGAVPYIMNRAITAGWGSAGKFMMPMAPWYVYGFTDTEFANFNKDVNMVVMSFDEDVTNSHEIAMDLYNEIGVPFPQKVYYNITAGTPDSPHATPRTDGGNLDVLDANGIWNTMDALAEWTFKTSGDCACDDKSFLMFAQNKYSRTNVTRQPIDMNAGLTPTYICDDAQNPRRAYCP